MRRVTFPSRDLVNAWMLLPEVSMWRRVDERTVPAVVEHEEGLVWSLLVCAYLAREASDAALSGDFVLSAPVA